MMTITIEVLILLFSINLSLFTIVYCLMFGKRSKLFYSFMYIHILTLIWILGHFVELTTVNINVKLLAMWFQNTAICFIGYVWLLFSCRYTLNWCKQKRSLWFIIFMIPFALYIGFLTNNLHGLVYTVFATKLYINSIEYGPLLWFNFVVNYLYICAGTLMIIQYSRTIRGYERRQSVFLILATLIPILCSILHFVKVVNLPYDITPLSLSISLLFFTVATFKYRFLNMIPLALHIVFETIDVATVLLDNEEFIVASNSTFKKIFSEFHSNSVVDFEAFLKQRTIGEITDNILFEALVNGIDTPIFGEIPLENKSQFDLQVAIYPVYDRKHHNIGRVVTFKDITSFKLLTRELEEGNRRLMGANHQLKNHMFVVEELAILKERNRLARDIHDTLGHTLTLLTKIQEAAILDFKNNPDKTLNALKKANEIARNGIKELRISINDIKPENGSSIMLFDALNRLAAAFTTSEVKVELNFDGDIEYINPTVSQTIYKICQEAITNSIKHGKATEIHIMLSFQENMIRLFIIDKGTGCQNVKKGFGLTGMEDRLRKLQGTIVFGSDGEHGFNIHIEIPLRGVSQCIS